LDAPHLDHAPGGSGDDVSQSRQILAQGAPPCARRPQRIRGDRPHRPVQSAVEHARDVEVPEEVASEWSAPMSDERIVSPHSIRDERVDVQIDQLAALRKLYGVKRASNQSRVSALIAKLMRIRSCASAIPL